MRRFVAGMLAISSITGCMHNVDRDISYATSQPRNDVKLVTNGQTIEFETLYLRNDSLGGPVKGASYEMMVSINEIERLYTREVHWGRILMVSLATFYAVVYIGLHGGDAT